MLWGHKKRRTGTCSRPTDSTHAKCSRRAALVERTHNIHTKSSRVVREMYVRILFLALFSVSDRKLLNVTDSWSSKAGEEEPKASSCHHARMQARTCTLTENPQQSLKTYAANEFHPESRRQVAAYIPTAPVLAMEHGEALQRRSGQPRTLYAHLSRGFAATYLIHERIFAKKALALTCGNDRRCAWKQFF